MTDPEILRRAIDGGHDTCNNGHVYMEGSWRWNKGHKQCLICRMIANRRRRESKKISIRGTRGFGRSADCPSE